jgi:hypothetical protein
LWQAAVEDTPESLEEWTLLAPLFGSVRQQPVTPTDVGHFLGHARKTFYVIISPSHSPVYCMLTNQSSTEGPGLAKLIDFKADLTVMSTSCYELTTFLADIA